MREFFFLFYIFQTMESDYFLFLGVVSTTCIIVPQKCLDPDWRGLILNRSIDYYFLISLYYYQNFDNGELKIRLH